MIPKKAVIAFLIFTAVLLTCVWALQQISFTDSSAQAGSTSRAGRYIVATTIFDNTRSLFWMANVDNQNLTVFSFLPTGGFSPLDSVDLKYVFRSVVSPETDPRIRARMPAQYGYPPNQPANPRTLLPPGQIRPPQRTDNKIKKKTDPNIIR